MINLITFLVGLFLKFYLKKGIFLYICYLLKVALIFVLFSYVCKISFEIYNNSVHTDIYFLIEFNDGI